MYSTAPADWVTERVIAAVSNISGDIKTIRKKKKTRKTRKQTRKQKSTPDISSDKVRRMYTR